MSKPVLFILLSALLFLGLFYSKDILFASEAPVIPAPTQEATVNVLTLVEPVEKGVQYSLTNVEWVEMTEKKAQQNGLLVQGSKIPKSSLFRVQLGEGTLLKRSQLSFPGDDDYISFTLAKDHVPYYYETDGKSVLDVIGTHAGDKVSFISTTNSYSNIHEAEFKDVSNLISEVLIHDAKVIQVTDTGESSSEQGRQVKAKRLVIELSIRQVMKLDIAKQIGQISIVPSNMTNQFLSVRSVDLLEKQHGVRELRAGSE